MTGVYRRVGMPVLQSGGRVAISDREKADTCVEAFRVVHSEANVGKEGLRARARMVEEMTEKLMKSSDNEGEAAQRQGTTTFNNLPITTVQITMDQFLSALRERGVPEENLTQMARTSWTPL
ncbi:hypothetical protein SKAU_G00194220 [Synaphobranchus kaupii]|uniref:Uncharacterized protein n=1 Tax=Synaphobranchus kaupii TaxID=118154 RepID=A0A9Q1FE26_SYNKA|nr:hypothetical protein SKAU_G00194220 [Synaphobranchus kaupii]